MIVSRFVAVSRMRIAAFLVFAALCALAAPPSAYAAGVQSNPVGPIDFGPVTVGQPFARPVTFSNSGAEPLSIVSFGATKPEFPVTGGTCAIGAVLPPGGSCVVEISFAPSLSGQSNGTFVFRTSDGATDLLGLTGLGVGGPALTLTPAGPMDFGSVGVGKPGVLKVFTLTNLSATATGIAAISTDPGNQDIVWSGFGSCAAYIGAVSGLQPGAPCTIDVAFTPTVPGQSNDVLTVQTTKGSLTVPLSGIGVVVPLLTLTPVGPVDFGSLGVGKDSLVKILTLKNVSNTPRSIQSISTDPSNPDIVWSGGDCTPGAPGLQPGGSCTIQVTFTPTVAGPSNDVLTAQTNQEDLTVPLSGVGVVVPLLILTPAGPVDFGSLGVGKDTLVKILTLKNVSNAPRSIASISTDPGNQDIVWSGFGSCAAYIGAVGGLQPGASCTIDVAFTPTVPGQSNDVLTVQTNQEDLAVPLSGTGVIVPLLTLTPAGPVDFGSMAVGKPGVFKVFTLTNVAATVTGITAIGTDPGNQDIVWSGFGSCADLIGGPPSGLLPGASCTINVNFTPTVPGPSSDVLTVQTTKGDLTVPLHGLGVALACAPGTYNTASGGEPCTPAPAGSYATGPGATGFLPCPQGTYSTGGAVNCTPAPPGSYATGPVATSVLPCPSGTYSTGGAAGCTPAQPGSYAQGPGATAELPCPAGFTSQTGAASCTAVAGGLTAAPSTLSFGPIVKGTNADRQEAKFTNNGRSPLTFTALYFSTTQGGPRTTAPFGAATTTCTQNGAVLQPGASCTVSVIFGSVNAGTFTGYLNATDNNGGSASVKLSGVATEAEVTSSPAILSFSPQQVGTQSDRQLVFFNNTGAASVKVTAIALTTSGGVPATVPFVITSSASSCAVNQEIISMTTCSVGVAFAPTAAGAVTATLVVKFTGGKIVNVPLTGTGVVAVPKGTNGSGTAPGVQGPANFQFLVTEAPGGGVTGSLPRLQFQKEGKDRLFQASLVDLGSFALSSAHASMVGAGRLLVPGTNSPMVGTYPFRMEVTDGFSSGQPDTIHIVIYSPNGNVFYEIGSTGAEVPISGGDIVVQ